MNSDIIICRNTVRRENCWFGFKITLIVGSPWTRLRIIFGDCKLAWWRWWYRLDYLLEFDFIYLWEFNQLFFILIDLWIFQWMNYFTYISNQKDLKMINMTLTGPRKHFSYNKKMKMFLLFLLLILLNRIPLRNWKSLYSNIQFLSLLLLLPLMDIAQNLL